MRLLASIILFWLPFIHFLASTNGSQVEKQLLRKLMTNYDLNVRPVLNSSNPVVVKFAISVSSILDLNERDQVFTTNLWVTMVWQDKRLVWNSAQYPLSVIRLDVNSLWTPDIMLYNKADDFSTGAGYKPVNALVKPDGFVQWLPPVVLRSACPIRVFHFPFDVQLCPLKFGSWSYDVSQLDLDYLDSRTVDQSSYMPNGEWILINSSLEYHRSSYSGESLLGAPTSPVSQQQPSYADMTLYMCMKRRSTYYWINVMAPCTCLNLLCIASFGMPPQAHGKVGLTASILLSYFVYNNAITERLPRAPDIPVIGLYLIASLVLAVISVTFAVTAVHYKTLDKAAALEDDSQDTDDSDEENCRRLPSSSLRNPLHALERPKFRPVRSRVAPRPSTLNTSNELHPQRCAPLDTATSALLYYVELLRSRRQQEKLSRQLFYASLPRIGYDPRIGACVNSISLAMSSFLFLGVLAYVVHMHLALSDTDTQTCRDLMHRMEQQQQLQPAGSGMRPSLKSAALSPLSG